jgi:hypothetical protein
MMMPNNSLSVGRNFAKIDDGAWMGGCLMTLRLYGRLDGTLSKAPRNFGFNGSRPGFGQDKNAA